MSDDEPTYQFVKGQGWVPKLVPDPEPVPPVTAERNTHRYTGLTFDQIIGEWQDYLRADRARELEQARAIHHPALYEQMRGRLNREAPYTRTTAPTYQPYTYQTYTYATDDDYFGWNTNRATAPRQIPREPRVNTTPRGEPREPTRQRYHPGAGERAQNVPVEENPHARRAREFREATERYARGRNRR